MGNRKLDFSSTPENLKKIQDHGASQEVFNLVKTLRPPPKVEIIPPPPPTGTLFISCEPAECEVSVDGVKAPPSKGGDVQQFKLPLKQYRVEISKEGYSPKSIMYTVTTADKPEKQFVKLEPTAVTKAKWGREILEAARQAVEGKAGDAALRNMTVSGTAVSTDGAGAYSEWGISAAFKFPPKFADYRLTKASNHFSMQCKADQCDVPKPGGSLFGGKTASATLSDSLDTNLRLLNRYNLVALLDRVSAPNQNVVAGSPRSHDGSEQHFSVENSDETYQIAVNSSLQPIKALYTAGALSVQVSYGDYTAVLTGAYYPSRTMIMPTGGKQGLQLTLTDFSPVAAREPPQHKK